MTTPRVLNVGGNSREIPLPPEYAGWDNVLLDIDPACNPDVLCDARELECLPAASFDSVYCSHNLEHYYPHDVARVLAGFQHVLKDEGFVFVRVPDIAVLMRAVVEQGLDITDILYQSSAGPITVRDVIYGYGREIERSGNDFFAHKTGFTEKSLLDVLHAAGFSRVFARTGFFEVAAFAFKNAPTAHAARLLQLPDHGASTGRSGDEAAADSGQDYSMRVIQPGRPEALEASLGHGTLRRLHIGGMAGAEGWEILNVSPAPCVDHVGNANDLSRFANGTFSEIYASHVVEHLDYKFELAETLKEWFRVLEPGGRVMISVPDLDILAGLIISKGDLTVGERFFVMQMIFGGHVDQHDYHVVGLNQEFLAYFLGEAGYVKARRVKNFNLFDDTSSMLFKGTPISLNMIAEKPHQAETGATTTNATATPYPSAGREKTVDESRGRVAYETLVVRTSDGISFSVPGSLSCPTTRILLEREQWIEGEVGFVATWLKPGMNAIDVGAGFGVYSLPMANAVGRAGRVIAFEPSGENRQHLEASRSLNGLENLTISACKISNEGKDDLSRDLNSAELSAPISDGRPANGNEPALVSTLDSQERGDRWPAIDFIRIGTAKQAGRIVAGAKGLLLNRSPLVMYQIMDGRSQNDSVRWIFEAFGYRTYKLLGDFSCLVSVTGDEQLDAFTSNLFGAKPDRAASLAAQGFLVENAVAHTLSVAERSEVLEDALAQPYARAFELSIDDVANCPYGEAFVAYAACRKGNLTAARRYAALNTAFALLEDYCRDNETPAGLATLTRVALDLGNYRVALDALQNLLATDGIELDQPFYPPCPRYELLSPEGRESEWFLAAANEQFELARSHLSCFQGGELDRLKWLCDSQFASAAIDRRLILECASRGQDASDFVNYLRPGQQHQNPSYWTAAGLPEIFRLR